MTPSITLYLDIAPEYDVTNGHSMNDSDIVIDGIIEYSQVPNGDVNLYVETGGLGWLASPQQVMVLGTGTSDFVLRINTASLKADFESNITVEGTYKPMSDVPLLIPVESYTGLLVIRVTMADHSTFGDNDEDDPNQVPSTAEDLGVQVVVIVSLVMVGAIASFLVMRRARRGRRGDM